MPIEFKEALKDAPTRTRSDVLRTAPTGVDREGGMYGAGVIRGVSAITRGEALGHGMWIDADMLAQVGEHLRGKGEQGVKVRFTHPGLSSDGLGKLLGRFTGGEIVGDKVIGDLHFVESAHNAPDGDLAEYVMNLAEESPDLFGTSIVFKPDHGAEDLFAAEHKDAEGTFISPDPLNKKNLRHARLAELRAVDAVDSPAANPDGMFSADAALMGEFSSIVDYALGVGEDTPPAPDWLPIHPARIRGFVQRRLLQAGLTIESGKPDLDKKDIYVKIKST